MRWRMLQSRPSLSRRLREIHHLCKLRPTRRAAQHRSPGLGEKKHGHHLLLSSDGFLRPVNCLLNFATEKMVDSEGTTALATLAVTEFFQHFLRARLVSGSDQESCKQADGRSEPWIEFISLLRECHSFLKRLPGIVKSLKSEGR